MFVISIHTLARPGPIFLLTSHLPTVQDSKQPVALMPERPEVSAAFWIDPEWNRLNQVRAVNRVLTIEAILSHHLATRERSLVSRQ